MSEKVFDSNHTPTHRDKTTRKHRISTSVRKISRECREEILTSHGYHLLWLGQLTATQYVQLLSAHYSIRRTLESLFDALSGGVRIRNLSNMESDSFTLNEYMTPLRMRASLLRADLADMAQLGNLDSITARANAKAQSLIEYMRRVNVISSCGLVGVLYMLEETVTYAGPIIARNVDRRLNLKGQATRYLRGAANQKADLWDFRRSLDAISDYQTRMNIVAAANMTYRMYLDLIDPSTVFPALRSTRLH